MDSSIRDESLWPFVITKVKDESLVWVVFDTGTDHARTRRRVRARAAHAPC